MDLFDVLVRVNARRGDDQPAHRRDSAYRGCDADRRCRRVQLLSQAFSRHLHRHSTHSAYSDLGPAYPYRLVRRQHSLYALYPPVLRSLLTISLPHDDTNDPPAGPARCLSLLARPPRIPSTQTLHVSQTSASWFRSGHSLSDDHSCICKLRGFYFSPQLKLGSPRRRRWRDSRPSACGHGSEGRPG